MTGNDGQRFDRLPATAADREVTGRASRAEVIEWWVDRFGLPADAFDDYTFWEKGAGKIWIFAADLPSPTDVEGLGMTFLRTRQEHWKPTTDAVQRFGRYLIVAHELAGDVEPIGVGLYVHGELRSVIPKGRRASLPARE